MPIPVTVLAGFLGSGKTTLLNGLLHAATDRKIAIIINEFGSIGIDGALVSGGEYFVELDNGCLCCALNKDLETTLLDICNRGPFDHIVIETTGLAEPTPVAWACNRPDLSKRLRVDAIVTVFAADSPPDLCQTYAEAANQVQNADILVLSKTDVSHDCGEQAIKRLRKLNTLAPIVIATPKEIPYALIFDTSLHAPPSPVTATAAYLSAHKHDLSSFSTLSIPLGHSVSEEALQLMLEQIPENVFRLKGFVHTDAAWGWTLVNMVAGRIELRPQTPNRANPQSALVFIGKQLDAAKLKASCAALPQIPLSFSLDNN